MYREDIDETYHSTHGAIQEALHVFIEKGLKEVEKTKEDFTILEVGFGTGLNALLTSLNSNSKIQYIGIEAFPIDQSIINQLNYISEIGNKKGADTFDKLHNAEWGVFSEITKTFSLKKVKGEIQHVDLGNEIDLVYYDAFGPNSQGEMWDINIFKKLYASMSQNGVFVTYCAKGQVRRDLQSVGFTVERLEGPPGKREMLRAVKK